MTTSVKYRLSISFGVPGQFGYDRELEDALDKLVGQESSDSGSGFGCRDVGWEPLFNTAEEMDDLVKTVKEQYPKLSVTYRESEWEES